jgi:hypothetical protein
VTYREEVTMINKLGYYGSISILTDEAVIMALFDSANKRMITPDLAVEQLIEENCGQ